MPRTIFSLALAATVLSGCVSQAAFNREVGLYDAERQINQQLESEIKADRVEISRLKDRLRVTVADELLFPEAGWEVTTQGKINLDKIVPALLGLKDHRIEVQGHTDNVPIGKNLRNRFPTNWELSCARAAEVVRYLQRQGVDPGRLSASGHGEFQPAQPNATPAGRAANRRTDIDLVPF
jgi:chemotaxis protein MotB